MSEAEAPSEEGPLARHSALRAQFEAEGKGRDRVAGTLSLIQLALFVGSAVLAGSGGFGGNPPMLWAAAGVFVAFLIVRGIQGRVLRARDASWVRRDLHERHIERLTERWRQFPATGADLLPTVHAYAGDLDIVGAGSLFQRIDVTHTRDGSGTLASWLGRPADGETIAARQAAVRELAGEVELRQELEAAILETGRDHLDPRPFLELMDRPGIFEQTPWLRFAAPGLPLATIALYAAGQMGWLPTYVWLVTLAAQVMLVRSTELHSAKVFDALGQRRGFVDGYRRLFVVAESVDAKAELLRSLRERLDIDGAPPSVQMGRLDRWVSWYEVRAQGMLHFFLNPALLWDLNCLFGIERWIETVGRKCGAWFEVLGEIEALSSLSVLLDQDPNAILPEVSDDGPLSAEGLAHPLLPVAARVANDVRLDGSGHAMIVTGSNMAGKSTLLRAVGVNLALALAGGPVVARRFVAPRVRLRASMRIADSLQTGASYFQAELTRLRQVVNRAEASPPVFFILDELLRGTNARARHIGARAVVEHLLERDGLGMVATHDVALSTLEDEHPGKVHNQHFTDVMLDGVMTFDYRLRPGVVKTSNALLLLREVGIEVPEDTAVTGPMPASVTSRPAESST